MLFVLQAFLAKPPPDVWTLAECARVLELESEIKEENAREVPRDQNAREMPRREPQLQTRDRLRSEYAAKAKALVEYEHKGQIRWWMGVMDRHLADYGQDKEEEEPGMPGWKGQRAAETNGVAASGLVESALGAYASWAEKCSAELTDSRCTSDEAFAAMTAALAVLSAGLPAIGDLECLPESMQIGPHVAKLRDTLDAEVQVASSVQRRRASLPTALVHRALRAVWASVTSAAQRTDAVQDLQRRMRGQLPLLEAKRPCPKAILKLHKEVKRLKKRLRHCDVDLEDCSDSEDAEEAKDELRQVRQELRQAATTRRKALSSCFKLLGQFPELLHRGSEHYIKSLQTMVDTHGLDVGLQSRSMFDNLQILSHQESKHIVYKAQQGNQE
jgi:hypothetical protein